MNITNCFLLFYGIIIAYMIYLLHTPSTKVKEHFGSIIDYNSMKNLSKAAEGLLANGVTTVPGNITVTGAFGTHRDARFNGHVYANNTNWNHIHLTNLSGGWMRSNSDSYSTRCFNNYIKNTGRVDTKELIFGRPQDRYKISSENHWSIGPLFRIARLNPAGPIHAFSDYYAKGWCWHSPDGCS